jgi:hypothetical protein
MKTTTPNLLKVLFITLLMLASTGCFAQFGNGFGRGGFGYGRQRSTIPHSAETPQKEDPKTAEEIVDAQMPSITKALELNEFENAVLSSVLKKYVQERIEAQILKLPPDKMKEVYENITQRQDEELKAGLPLEKYEAFVELQKNGVAKTLKKKKKKKKNKS